MFDNLLSTYSYNSTIMAMIHLKWILIITAVMFMAYRIEGLPVIILQLGWHN